MYKQWMKATIIRCLRSFAQGAGSAVGISAQFIGDVNWALVLSGGAFSFIITFFMCLAGLPEVDNGSDVLKIIEDEDRDGAQPEKAKDEPDNKEVQ